MSIDFKGLQRLLKQTPYKVFRDIAPKNTPYPYVVYSFVSEDVKIASGSIYKRLPLYQVSLFTTGTEKDLEPIIEKLNSEKVLFSTINSMLGDLNDDQVTHFYFTVRCVEDA